MNLAHNFVRTAAFALTTTLALTACRGTDPAGSATDTEGSSSSSSTDAMTTTSGAPTTSGGSTTSGVVDSSSGDVPTTTNMSAGFITTDTAGTTTSGGVDPQPDGGQCMSDADCISMNCFEIPMVGGVCGECDEDQDCVDAMTGVGCSLTMAGGVCSDGEVGDGCMSDDACMDGFTCGPVIDIPIPGIIPDSCNECESSADCDMGTVCNPNFNIMDFSGSKTCVEPGSVMNDALCDVAGDGDVACMSTKCGEVMIMGIITVGVCGECKSDADCMGGTCVPGTVDMGGAMGSVCM